MKHLLTLLKFIQTEKYIIYDAASEFKKDMKTFIQPRKIILPALLGMLMGLLVGWKVFL